MIIKADKEAGKILMDLCDVALKVGGMKNLNTINKIVDNINIEEEKEEQGEVK